MSNVFLEKKKNRKKKHIINLSSAELDQSVVKVNMKAALGEIVEFHSADLFFFHLFP